MSIHSSDIPCNFRRPVSVANLIEYVLRETVEEQQNEGQDEEAEESETEAIKVEQANPVEEEAGPKYEQTVEDGESLLFTKVCSHLLVCLQLILVIC